MTRTELWQAFKASGLSLQWDPFLGEWQVGSCSVSRHSTDGTGPTPEAAIAAALGVEWKETERGGVWELEPISEGPAPNIPVKTVGPERRPDALTLAEAVAELEAYLRAVEGGRRDVDRGKQAACALALSILLRVDPGEDSRLLDALEALCLDGWGVVMRQFPTDASGNTLGYNDNGTGNPVMCVWAHDRHANALPCGTIIGQTLRDALSKLEAEHGN